jgi:hypothetical protein
VRWPLRRQKLWHRPARALNRELKSDPVRSITGQGDGLWLSLTIAHVLARPAARERVRECPATRAVGGSILASLALSTGELVAADANFWNLPGPRESMAPRSAPSVSA